MARARTIFSRVAAGWLLAGLCVAPSMAQQSWLVDWASQKQLQIHTVSVGDDAENFSAPVPLELPARIRRELTPSEQARADATISLYSAMIGGNAPNSLLWSGIETANPLTRDEGYRWNSLRDQGLFDPDQRAKLISEVQSLGLVNIRIGLSNHEIDLDEPASWAEHDAFVSDLAKAGLNLSLDIHHFGIEDRFRVTDAAGRTIPSRSYYLNPEWPDYFARFAAAAFERYGASIKAVTLINEPETTVGFNSEMWNGGFPGWGDPRHGQYYIERAFALARAAVKARSAIQSQLQSSGQRMLFMHTEAAVYKPGRPDFNRFVRFIPSDLILGQSWLLNADLETLANTPLAALDRRVRRTQAAQKTSLDWLVGAYVLSTHSLPEREARRTRLLELLTELRDLHLALARDFGVTMKTDTVFAADYYAHNEDVDPQGAWLNPEPQLYAAQMQGGARRGLYPLIIDYYNHYGLPMMIGETGTPFYAYGARWHAQLLLELAQTMQEGVPMLGYTIYPLVDTRGWESALSVPKSRTTVNTGGILDVALEARPFIRALLQSLNNQTAENLQSVAPQSVQ